MGCIASKQKIPSNSLLGFPLSPGPAPSKRKYYSVCHVADRQEIYLFGGCIQLENSNAMQAFADLYCYSLVEKEWRKLWDGNEILRHAYKNKRQSARKSVKFSEENLELFEINGPLGWYSCTITHIKHMNALMFLGGIRGNEESEESNFINVWLWHLDDLKWELLHTYGARPDVVRDHVVVYHSPNHAQAHKSNEQIESQQQMLPDQLNHIDKSNALQSDASITLPHGNDTSNDIHQLKGDHSKLEPITVTQINSFDPIGLNHSQKEKFDNFKDKIQFSTKSPISSIAASSSPNFITPQTPQTPQTMHLHRKSKNKGGQFFDLSQEEAKYEESYIFSKNVHFANDIHGRHDSIASSSTNLSSSKLILFGGHCGYTFPNPVFILDMDSMSWIRSESEHCPMRRYGHSLHWMDESEDKMILFGGCIDYRTREIDNTVWTWSLHTREWNVMRTRGAKPEPRYNHASLVKKNRMYIYGGHPFHEELYTRLYILDFQSNFWISILLHQPVIDDFTLISSQTRIFSFLILIENESAEKSKESAKTLTYVKKGNGTLENAPEAIFFDVEGNEISLEKWIVLTGCIENTSTELPFDS